MKYELYHDESREGGYWHGMLLVPVDKKNLLLDYLSSVRENIGYTNPIGIKKVKRKGRIYDCADSWVQLGVAALMSREAQVPIPIFLGQRIRGNKQYTQFSDVIGTKFIVFRERDGHARMTGHPDYGSKVETTFRMGLKGGLHFLGSKEETIHIERMHFDGYEHYRRHIDFDRVVNRLSGLRTYCSIAKGDDLIDDRTSDHTRENSQDYGNCQLLQLADLLVGCFRTVLSKATRPIHTQLAHPVRSIVERYHKGRARMRNSRWRDSFCISQCYLDSGKWKFETMEYRENQ